MIMGKDGERGQVECRLKKKVKIKSLHYWEDIIDLLPGPDV